MIIKQDLCVACGQGESFYPVSTTTRDDLSEIGFNECAQYSIPIVASNCSGNRSGNN